MATRITTRVMKRTVTSAMLASYLALTSCGLDDLIQSQYTVDGVEKDAVYVGFNGESRPAAASSLPRLPDFITINFDSIKNEAPVSLNGQHIGDLFAYGPHSATLETSKIRDFLRQGKNRLSVDSLNFGPSIEFTFDNQGPIIEVTRVEELTNALNLTVRVDDSTTADSVFIQRYSYSFDGGTEPSPIVNGQTNKKQHYAAIGGVTSLMPITGQNNEWETVSSITPASLYKITAIDAYGYTSERWYLAPEEKINNVFRLKLDKKILDSMVPIAPLQMRGVYTYSPLAMDIYGSAGYNIYRGGYPKLIYNEDFANAGTILTNGVNPDDIKDPWNPKPAAMLDQMNKFWQKGAMTFPKSEMMGLITLGKDEANCGWINTDSFTTDTTVTINGQTYKAYKEGPYVDNSGNWHFPPGFDYKEGECSRIIVYYAHIKNAENMTFTLDQSKAGDLYLDVVINKNGPAIPGFTRGLEVALSMRHIKCGKGKADRYCFDNGGVEGSAIGATARMGGFTLTADSIKPQGTVGVNIHNGALDVNVSKASLGIKNGTSFTKFPGQGDFVSFIGIPLTGLIESIAGSLDGTFVEIVGKVIKSNLPEFVIGFDMFSEWDGKIVAGDDSSGASLKMQSQGYQVTTNAGKQPSGTNPQWYMQYAGFLTPYMDRIKQKRIAGKLIYNLEDPDAVQPVLGSPFVPDEVLQPLSQTEDLDMAISVNVVNQALTSFYLAGLTHWTATSIKPKNHREEDCQDTPQVTCKDLVKYMHAGNTWLANGPHRTDETENFIAKKGDTRVELIPRTPPIFEMGSSLAGGGETTASLYYRNARMKIQSYDGNWTTDGLNGWKVNFDVEVDLKIAAIMHIEDQSFKITVLGKPDLILNNVKLGSEKLFGLSIDGLSDPASPANRLVKGALQFGVNTVLDVVVPVLSKQYGTLKFPGIYIPASNHGVYVTSETIKANNGQHLAFGMNFTTGPCTLSQESQDKMLETRQKAMVLCEPDE